MNMPARPGHAPRGLHLCLAASLLLSACAASGPSQPYTPPPPLRQAQSARVEFIQSYLQGKCRKARIFFRESTLGFLLGNDSCAAAHNSLMAWRLQVLAGGPAEQSLLDQASRLAGHGLFCPEFRNLLADPYAPASPEGRELTGLLVMGELPPFFDRLLREEDPLFRSAYARKAARSALETGDREWADRFLNLAEKTDGEFGWIVFLREDLRLRREISGDAEAVERLEQRIRLYSELIEECSDTFAFPDVDSPAEPETSHPED